MIDRAKRAPGIALAGYFGLLGLWVAWATVLAGPRHAPAALVLMAAALPLLPWLRGLLHDRRSAYVWLGLLSLAYFIHGVGAFATPPERHLAALEILFSLTLFGGCLMRLQRNQHA